MVKKFMVSPVLFTLFITASVFAQGSLDQRVAELSQQIAKEMKDYQKTTIAVVQFTDLDGNVTDFGKYLAEELITRLFQTKMFKVIERQLLNKVIAEQKLSLTGMIDPNSAKQLGKLLGVDAICSGTITDLAQSLRVNARLISTETGEIFAVASTEIFKDESVLKLMASGGVSASPNVSTMQNNTSAPAGPSKAIAPGMIFKVEDKEVEFEKRFRVRLTGIEILEKNRVKAVMTLENLHNGSNDFSLPNPESRTYLLDQDGQQYRFIDATVIPANAGQTFPAGVPIKFTVTFDAIPSNTASVSIVVLIDDMFSWASDVTFKDVRLR
ncbi:MAG: FlgO family outer membrane protein [Candidatus Kryptoniota bacterium]